MAADKDVTLSYFSDSFQEAVVGWCLINERFFVNCKNKIKPEWLTAKALVRDIFDQLIKFYNEHGKIPQSRREFLERPHFKSQDAATLQAYSDHLQLCEHSRTLHSLDIIKKDLTGFIRVAMVKEIAVTAAHKLNRQGGDSAYMFMREKITQLSDATFEEAELREKFDDYVSELNSTFEKDEYAISTGSAHLDEALGGGLYKSEASVVMASSNTGKTTSLITMARHAIVSGYKVLFIAHEGNQDRLKRQFIQSITGYTYRELKHYLRKTGRDPNNTNNTIPDEQIERMHRQVRQDIAEAERLLEDSLVFIFYVKTGKMFIEDVVDLIKKQQTEAINRWGRGFDLVIDDYPKKLKVRGFGSNGGAKDALRVMLGDIYDQFNFLASELKVHCLLAAQTNREGAKKNKGTIESKVYMASEDVDESYAIVQNMAAIITLNRSPQDAGFNQLVLNVAKSRSGPTDGTVLFRTDYGRSILWGDPELFAKYGHNLNTNSTTRGGLASVYTEKVRADKWAPEEANKALQEEENKRFDFKRST
jgi:replicative DNA helicase